MRPFEGAEWVRRHVVALGVLPTLLGCAHEIIKWEMPAFKGQPVSAVIAKLGFPSEERVIAGQKVYIWSTSNLIDGTSGGLQLL